MSKKFKSEVMAQLRQSASDTSKPHKFEFYVYLPTKSYAQKAAAKIRTSGFSAAKVSRSVSGNGWLCVARKTLIPRDADLNDQARFLNEVAAALGGDWDGWEGEIVEK